MVVVFLSLLVSVERSRPYPGSSHASSKRSVGIVVGLFISCGVSVDLRCSKGLAVYLAMFFDMVEMEDENSFEIVEGR